MHRVPGLAAAALVFAAILPDTAGSEQPDRAARGTEVLMLDFWSPHCGPCMQMKPMIQNFKHAGYPIREVDATRDQALVRQFNVTHLPCFVMLVDGQEVDRQVGSTGTDRLQGMFKEAHEEVRRRIEQRRGQSLDPPRQERQGLLSSSDASLRRDEGEAGAEAFSDLHARLLAATVRLRVDDANGHSYGTGTIIDARSGQALVITCGHLFRESQGKGPVSVELFEAVPGGVRVIGQVPAQVISYDLKRDIALVGIWPSQTVTVARLAAADSKIDRGMRVVSIGCSNGKDPTVLASRITAVDRYQGPPNIEASGAPVEGRSGGGLFNSNGDLIGVCFAADYDSNEGLYAALEAIHDELADRGLSDITASAVAAAGDSTGEAASNSVTPIVRGQEPLVPVVPVAHEQASAPQGVEDVAAESPTSTASAPQGLSAVEQAAWEEIMARAATAEVICIIRPKEPGGQSEVITLDEVSPEFVRALAERRRAPQEARQR
jgi:thiol-disulfide isomerase/thioredoxin